MAEHATLMLRPAGPDDAIAVADLHTRSWRSAYRGMFSDAYLDGPIVEERRWFWGERLRHPRPELWTLLADRGGRDLVGFVCAEIEHDPQWGTLIDNLHVDPGAKRNGLGRLMLRALGAALADLNSPRPVHLFVLRTNHDALGAYQRLGGEIVEEMIETVSDGSQLPIYRVAWPGVTAFVDRVG